MIKKVCVFTLLFISVIFSRQISFQLYVNDLVNQTPLSTDEIISIESSFVDANDNTYFVQSQNQKITDGIIHMRINVDFEKLSEVYVFDKRGLQLRLRLLDDELLVPISAVPLAIVSKLSDRVTQLKDPSLMTIFYDDHSVNFGGAP